MSQGDRLGGTFLENSDNVSLNLSPWDTWLTTLFSCWGS